MRFLAIFWQKFFCHKKMHDFSSKNFFLILAEISAKNLHQNWKYWKKTQKFHLPKDLRLFWNFAFFFREKLHSCANSGLRLCAHFDFFGLKNVKTYASNFWKFLMAENAWKIFLHAFPYIFHEKKKQHFIYQRICAYFEMLLFFFVKNIGKCIEKNFPFIFCHQKFSKIGSICVYIF